jgi:hypothetical protein
LLAREGMGTLSHGRREPERCSAFAEIETRPLPSSRSRAAETKRGVDWTVWTAGNYGYWLIGRRIGSRRLAGALTAKLHGHRLSLRSARTLTRRTPPK